MTLETIHCFEENIKSKVELYAKALVDTTERKTCIEMGKSQNVTHDRMYRALSHGEETINYVKAALFQDVLERAKRNPDGKFALDDGSIMKQYAKEIEGLSPIRDGATGRIAYGLATVVLGWSDSEGFIPFDHEFWFPRELVQDAYRSKQQIAQQLILRYKDAIKPHGIVMDGLYAQLNIIKLLNEQGITFEMKMHANRVIEFQGLKRQVQHHPQLLLMRNSRGKTISALWQGISLFVTVEKMKNRDGSIAYRYLMSNQDCLSRQHISMYWLRWPVEKFFRTAKQKLGFTDCQARKIELHNAHIFNVFYAYVKLQTKTTELKLDSIDILIRYLRSAKSRQIESPISSSDQIFSYYA
jgi:hypothetical protein